MKNREYTIAVVGAGAVGQEMIRILKERDFPASEIRWLARTSRTFRLENEDLTIEAAGPDSFEGVDIALFAGTEGEKGAAKTLGAEALKKGAVIIDNGSDFRMNPDVPLVIPEINGKALENHKGIIANPNCSAAVMLMAIAPLHKIFGISRVIVSTYQSVSGAGEGAVLEFLSHAEEILKTRKVDPACRAFNVKPHDWAIEEHGFSNEEWKMIRESRKILEDESLEIIPTTARVGVLTAHCESIFVELKRPARKDEVERLFNDFPGVSLAEGDESHVLTPAHAAGKDDIFVGRIRKIPGSENEFAFWVVGDNLRKGAALNTVHIAEELIRRNLVRVPQGSASLLTGAGTF